MSRESRTIRALRAAGVFNPYEFYRQGGPKDERVPYIDYYASAPRDVWPSEAIARLRGTALADGDPHYRERDDAGGSRRGFVPGGVSGAARKRQAIEMAIEWARERFGIEEWKRDPFGSYGPAEFVDKRTRELLALAEGKG